MRAITSPLVIAVRRGIVGGGGAVDPLQELIQQLFGNSEQGAFYLPRPVVNGQQVLFQDAAGAVPVAADGDPVGLMKDLSGAACDAAQTTSASRPTYRTDGVMHWLEFDGVDDFLRAEEVTLKRAYAAVNFSGGDSSGAVYGVDSNINKYSLFHTGGRVYLYDNSGSVATQTFSDFTSDGMPHVWSARHDLNSGASIRLDGGLFATGSTDEISGNLYIGRRENSTGLLVGNFYGGAVSDTDASPEALADVEAYLANLTGVVLP